MLSEKAEKTKNIYKRMSFFLSLGVAEPGKVSKVMAGFVRYNFNNIAKFFSVAKDAKYEEIILGGVRTWKVTTPNSDPKKILLFRGVPPNFGGIVLGWIDASDTKSRIFWF